MPLYDVRSKDDANFFDSIYASDEAAAREKLSEIIINQLAMLRKQSEILDARIKKLGHVDVARDLILERVDVPTKAKS